VAATRSAKNPTKHNDTPNTPDVKESAIAKMKVDELRRKLRGHGVKDTAELKKPDLVQRLIKAEVAATRKPAKKSASAKKTVSASSSTKTSPAKSSPAKSSSTKTSSAKTSPAKSSSAKTSSAKTSSAKRSVSKNPTPGNDTPNTPDVSESAIAAMKADAIRRKLRSHGVKGTAELKKPELVQQLIKIEVSAARKKTTKKKAGSAK
jgi:hypothetical protein